MKNLSTWLLVMFMIMFWVFRIIVAFTAQYGKDFGGFIAFNFTEEVILLFVAILSFIFVVRRKLIGGILYLGGYGYYFGKYLLFTVLPSYGEGGWSVSMAQIALVAALGIIIAFCVMFDLLVARARRRTPSDRKTDWFFQNKEFDRKLDERADKNQYRNY